jgi:uncharacterized protein
MDVVVKTFQTPNGKYVFVRETNSILLVDDVEFSAFERIENGEACDKYIKVLQRYIDQGYLIENGIEKIAFPDTFRYQLNSRVQQLTLQVTQNCNLRCSYCTYGGSYYHQRTHSKKTMPLSIMKKAVDFAMARSREVKSLSVGFYGGEPLLEIDLIKDCVDYINETYPGRDVQYNITTNGTIFDEGIIAFLNKNDFSVSISFDGPRELHDMNRTYEDGRGSFDDIMQNMNYIKENYPMFFRRISFLTIVAPGADFACVNDFYEAETVISDNMIQQNRVNDVSSKEGVTYDDQYFVTAHYQQMKVLLAAIGLYSENKISKLFATGLSDAERCYQTLSSKMPAGTTHPGGPCVSGAMRLFVSCDGVLYPCERVNEGSEIMKIGHIDTGFELEKIEKQINVGKITEEECIACWNFMHCALCCATADGGMELSRENRLAYCLSAMNRTLDNMKTVCLLLENGYDFELKATERRRGRNYND